MSTKRSLFAGAGIAAAAALTLANHGAPLVMPERPRIEQQTPGKRLTGKQKTRAARRAENARNRADNRRERERLRRETFSEDAADRARAIRSMTNAQHTAWVRAGRPQSGIDAALAYIDRLPVSQQFARRLVEPLRFPPEA